MKVNLNRLRDRIGADVRVRLEVELHPDEPKGKLNPALLAFNDAVHHHNIVRMVRRWVVDQPLKAKPHNPQRLAENIISETRVRIARYRESPVVALSLAAVLNTIVYRDNSVLFDVLAAQAKQEFSARL